ncbi:MAG: hypothetical protein CMJ08_05630 [Pelagibacterales bacterium]|nr:hypothetical protein [Pelagibacterales bacterium]
MKKKLSFSNKINLELKNSRLEKNKILMLHVRLKKITVNYRLDYKEAVEIILTALKGYSPKNIIVPSFTYSFANGEPFHYLKSPSEVGLFSEIFRKNYSRHRVIDPMFSNCHLKDFNTFYEEKKIDFFSAFNKGSIWELFYKLNICIVNIGLDHLIISLIHYIEFLCKVPYRSEIKKIGKIYSNNSIQAVSYNFYARKLNLNLGLDWNKIENVLIKKKAIFVSKDDNLKIKVCKIKTVADVLIPLIKKDPFFLVKKV